MKRYAEIYGLLNKLPDDLPYKASVKRVLIQAPAADVVEVVRCKDCKYWEKGKDYEPYCNHWGNMMTETKEDDFCSYGERKE